MYKGRHMIWLETCVCTIMFFFSIEPKQPRFSDDPRSNAYVKHKRVPIITYLAVIASFVMLLAFCVIGVIENPNPTPHVVSDANATFRPPSDVCITLRLDTGDVIPDAMCFGGYTKGNDDSLFLAVAVEQIGKVVYVYNTDQGLELTTDRVSSAGTGYVVGCALSSCLIAVGLMAVAMYFMELSNMDRNSNDLVLSMADEIEAYGKENTGTFSVEMDGNLCAESSLMELRGRRPDLSIWWEEEEIGPKRKLRVHWKKICSSSPPTWVREGDGTIRMYTDENTTSM